MHSTGGSTSSSGGNFGFFNSSDGVIVELVDVFDFSFSLSLTLLLIWLDDGLTVLLDVFPLDDAVDVDAEVEAFDGMGTVNIPEKRL